MPLAKHLSKEMILDAQNKTLSNRAAARYLGCSYKHYKRFAQIYTDENGENLFKRHLNPHGVGIPKFLTKDGMAGDIMDVIEGRVPMEHFTPQKIRDKLIIEGYLKEECYKCGLNEGRISDGKRPLILNFKDNNKKNFKLDNIELLCYNCMFLYVQDIFTEKQIIHMEDFIPTPESQKIDWSEVDKNFEKHFRQLGFIDPTDEEKNDGSEYISRLK